MGSYYLGKGSTGVSDTILGSLGIKTVKSPTSAATTSPSAISQPMSSAPGSTSPGTPDNPETGGTPAATNPVILACRYKCDKQHRRDLVDAGDDSRLIEQAEEDWNNCLEACGDEVPDPGRKPCKQVCQEQYTLDKDADKLKLCLEKCPPDISIPSCKEECSNAWAIHRDEGRYNECLNRCDNNNSCPPGQVWNNATKKCEGTPNPQTCPEGQVWDATQKKCIPAATTGGCGPSNTPGEAHTGCEPCGKKYMANSAADCKAGYVFVPKGNNPGYQGQCECSKWCTDTGYEADCVTKKGTQNMGEFNWPPWMKSLMDRLGGRANQFMNMKPGYSDSVISAMFGQNFDKLRGADTATRQGAREGLASEGLLGTGAGADTMNRISWNTEQGVANTQRDLLAANEAVKRQDLTSFTDSAQKLLAQGMSMEQIREAINSSRRGEGSASQAMWLQYLMSLMNSYNQG